MAHASWKYGVWLGLLGFALASGCTVKSGDGDDDDAGEAGEGGSSGSSTGGKGGSSGSSGSSGKGGSGGSSGTSTGGSSGTSTGGSSGTGTGGSGGDITDPMCDPILATPADTCEPRPGSEDDPCEICLEANCCEEKMECFGFDPGNVCGWGAVESGPYQGFNELDCYQACALDYWDENGLFDTDGQDACAAECATCSLIGDATNAIVGCMLENCEADCFDPTFGG